MKSDQVANSITQPSPFVFVPGKVSSLTAKFKLYDWLSLSAVPYQSVTLFFLTLAVHPSTEIEGFENGVDFILILHWVYVGSP